MSDQVSAGPPPPLLDVPQVAEILGLSTKTVARMRESGDLPYVRLGTRVMFTAADVKDVIERSRVAG